jgi:hypothetical protein
MNPEPNTARRLDSETEDPIPNAEPTPGPPADGVQYPSSDRHGWRGYFPAARRGSTGNSAELELNESYESLLARFASTHSS